MTVPSSRMGDRLAAAYTERTRRKLASTMAFEDPVLISETYLAVEESIDSVEDRMYESLKEALRP